jgi:hypothetical protein
MIYMTRACLGILMLVACTKPSSPPETDAGTEPATAAAAAASPAKDTAAAPRAESVTFDAKYTSEPGTLYMPSGKERFKNDLSKMLGDGVLTVTVDADGRVSGASEGGPLGPTILDGEMNGQVVMGTIRRSDPSDEGLTGTLVATRSGDKIEGTMKLSDGNAAVVRQATISGQRAVR